MGKGVLLVTPPVHKRHGGGWQHKLKMILLEHNHQKKNQKGQASYRSQEARATRLFDCFRTLRRDLHYGIEDPKNLKPRHVEALVKFWVEKELAPSSIDNNLSVLRLFSGWVNKNGMVKSLSDYAPDVKRTYAATRDKSWSANVEDPWALWERVYQEDKNIGMQLLFGMAFGARKKEMLCFKPFIDVRKYIIVLKDGVKGARIRDVEIETEFQHAVLEALKDHIRKRKGTPKEWIGDPRKTLKQNESRYYYVLRKCGVTMAGEGVTGHGLRVEFALSQLEKRGLVSTLRGGTASLPDRDKFTESLHYLRVSEQLGHSRKSVITAYYGPLRKKSNTRVDVVDGEISASATTTHLIMESGECDE